MSLDATDIKILTLLQDNGRITNSRLAKEAGISPPAMLERVKRLEASGVIHQYVTLLDREKVGFGLLVMTMISLSFHQISSLQQVMEQLRALEEVLECYQITGDSDFLIKVAVKDMNSYTAFVNNKLSGIPGIQNITTSFVLETVKSTAALPIKSTEP